VAGNPVAAFPALLLGAALLMIFFILSGVVVNSLAGLGGYGAYAEMLGSPSGRMLYRICQASSTVIAWAMPALLWAFYLGSTRGHLGLGTATPLSLKATVALIPVFLFPVAIMMIIPESLGVFPQSLQEKVSSAMLGLLSDDTWPVLLLNILVVAVLPAISEELFFRGFLLNALSRLMPVHAAVWVGAVVFSLVHFQLYGFISRVFLGAVLGYVYVWSGDVRMSMIAHFMHNLTATVVVLLTIQSGGNVSEIVHHPLLGVVSGIIGFSLLYVYFRRFSKINGLSRNE
jgi:uncharacterized protein